MNTNASAKEAELTLSLLREMVDEKITRDVGFRLWNGTCFPDDAPRKATMVLNHPGSLRSMLLSGGEVGLAEAYLFDDFDIEGNAEDVFSLSNLLTNRSRSFGKKWRAAGILLQLPAGPERRYAHRGPAKLKGKLHSIQRDREAVTYHYDVSNDFYALWLDRSMSYSCAYFQNPDVSLDQAQEDKLDYLCRKLRLQPGQRLLDIGCGWGALILHAARHYGVDATGITLSQPQVELANQRIAGASLANRCCALLRDYRELSDPGAYDALVSVGMFEHVGEKLLPVYFAKAYELLKPGGVFLNHGIANCCGESNENSDSFTGAYVFPDGELTPISTTLAEAEAAGFEVRDVENLREHYILTLRHWVRRLEERHEQALLYVDEPTYRVWRLYMSGSAYRFKVGRLNLYQSLLVRRDAEGRSEQPLTRKDWYR
ncbi:MAG: cyclopropane-fatty-acyl-phospholipid synthase family protein [Candidatus Omnitrophota bacterium]